MVALANFPAVAAGAVRYCSSVTLDDSETASFMNYEELPRAALVRLLQEHDEALQQAGKDGIVMNYSGRTAP